ncbi:MAG TPA: arylsulfatase [Pirellulales bacterium]|jgi:arylsulfatase A-like enzyme|nr:arylsulfatase [Pirellulales bacterium]
MHHRLVLLLSILCAAFGHSLAAAAPRPNVIVILSDDLGYGSLTCYGAKGLHTPALDRLASEGRRFTNAYATGSVCSPTRYALMTGRYFWRTDVKDGYALLEDSPLDIESNRLTLASLAKNQGYRTAAIGKWHLGFGTSAKTDWNQPLTPGPLSVGFDYYFGLATHITNHPRAYIEDDTLISRTAGQLVAVEGRGKDQKTVGIDPLPAADTVMDTLTGKAVAWLEENHQSPFFLYFAPNAVHHPITPSQRFHGSRYGKYGDFIEELDWSVGRILETLDKLKLADNTLVIFTSDNGGVMNPKSAGDENVALKAGLAINGILRGGKHSVFEGGFREPFIIRWPGRVPAGTVCDQIVCHADVLATLADVLNVPLPSGSAEDSLDVSSSCFGDAAARPARDSVVLQAAAAAEYAVRQGPWKLIEHENRPPNPGRNPVINKRTLEQRKHTPQHDELFNLADDPSETHDVAAEHPEVVARLRTLLHEVRDVHDYSRPMNASAGEQ